MEIHTCGDPSDLILWPDGTWCFKSELHEYSHMSDDYVVYPLMSDEWAAFFGED